MSDVHKDMNERYTKWDKIVQKAAMKTIGKTTVKSRKMPKPSLVISQLRKERRELKDKFEKEKDYHLKRELRDAYIHKQKEIQTVAAQEENERNKKKFEKMIAKGNNGFWKERRHMKRDDGADWLIVKDENGKRGMDPDVNKEIIARYYESLYSPGNIPSHPYHQFVKDKVESLGKEKTINYELDTLPTREEIRQAISNKKNGKATSDWSNEIIKR